MAHPRERNDSQAFGIPGTFRSFVLVVVVVIIAVVFVDSIRTARRNAENAETAVLRERFPKCTYGLIYSILSTPPEISAEIFCMNARDYEDAIAINRIRYDVILHSVSSTDPTLIGSAIFWPLLRISSRFSLIRFNIQYNIYSARFCCTKYEILSLFIL